MSYIEFPLSNKGVDIFHVSYSYIDVIFFLGGGGELLWWNGQIIKYYNTSLKNNKSTM